MAGKYGRGFRARKIAEVVPILDSVGLDAVSRRALQQVSGPSRPRQNTISRPDRTFLDSTASWIRDLSETNDSYDGNQYYLDLMGVSDESPTNGADISRIFVDWIYKLQNQAGITIPDFLIAPKDGNVLLCRQIADRLGLPLILCKGVSDSSRIRLSNGKVHETDFEGLRAFCDRETAQTPGSDARVYRALIVDDSCKNGGQLASAADRFNKLLDDGMHGLSLKFDAILSAVVLFRVRTEGLHDQKLHDARLTLHSLVALGDSELSDLRAKKKPSGADSTAYKRDTSCRESIRLFEGGAGQSAVAAPGVPMSTAKVATDSESPRVEGGAPYPSTEPGASASQPVTPAP